MAEKTMAQKQSTETDAADAAPGAPTSGTIQVPLRKPIQAYGEEVRTLTFREPTGADLIACGDPVTFDFGHEPPRPVFDTKAMSAMMARLAAVPDSSIGQMHPKDWKNSAWALSGFFTPDLAGGGTS